MELYSFISGYIKNKNSKLYRINGIQDHIHIMCEIHPSISVSDYVKDIKISSNIWMKQRGLFPLFDGWQEGYGAFSYSIREKEILINYIKNQKEHHKKENSLDEFRRLLVENQIAFDEKFVV